MTKMIKLALLSFILLFAIMPSYAQKTRTEVDAQAIAEAFFPKSRGSENVKQTLAYTELDSTTNHPYYYVFNRDNNKGWIIICADGRTKSILGYSDTGHFDMATAPPEMKAWLKDCSAQLRDLSITPDEVLKNLDQYVLSKARSKGSQSFANAVKPLLGRIAYGQDYPYNLMTPVFNGQNSVTGCVATGIVQIMRYWQYPKKPTGKSHSYNLNGQNIGTYFNTAYDWANMLPTYSNVQSTQRQNEAVSKLMVDVGISSEMEYTPDESGAYTSLAAGHLADFFDYDNNMLVYKRQNFSEANFVYFLKRELNAGRPVLFAGSGGGSGHCFVCDGYDTNGLFHFNWGWDGMCNGYYAINNLAPTEVGTGGGQGQYNDDVFFIGGIRPTTGKPRHTWIMRIKDMYYPGTATVGQRSSFRFMEVGNETPQPVKGQIGIALYQNGKFSKVIGTTSFGEIELDSWWKELSVSATWPTSLTSGSNYQAVAVFKIDGDDKWHPLANNTCNSFDLKVSGKSITLKPITSMQFSDIDDNPFDISPDGYEQGIKEQDQEENTTNPVMASQLTFQTPVRSGNVTASAVLTSRGAYQGKVGVFIYDSQFSNCIATVQAKTVSVRDGKTEVNFNGVVQLDPGTYGAALFYADRQGKWFLVPEENYSCTSFTVGTPGKIQPPSPSDNIIPGDDDNVVNNDDNVSPNGNNDDNVNPNDNNDDNVNPYNNYDEIINPNNNDDYNDINNVDLADNDDNGNIIPGEEYGQDNGLDDMDDDDDWDDDDWDNDFYNNDDDYNEGLLGYDDEMDDYDDYFDDDDWDDDGNYNFNNFSFSNAFSKSSNPNEPLKCESMLFAKAKPESLDGNNIYSFRLGQEDGLTVSVVNTKDTEHRRILTASLFDSDNNWVADMSEIFVILPAKSSKKVHLPLQFTDVPPGPYRLCLTEAGSEEEESRQMQPQATSQMYIQIKR